MRTPILVGLMVLGTLAVGVPQPVAASHTCNTAATLTGASVVLAQPSHTDHWYFDGLVLVPNVYTLTSLAPGDNLVLQTFGGCDGNGNPFNITCNAVAVFGIPASCIVNPFGPFWIVVFCADAPDQSCSFALTETPAD